tara:strand:- start:629 stop:811 length:183 start_codon:yes stop_codon:yes gene_type:complete
MRYELLIITLIFLSSCTSKIVNNDTVLNIDIYKNDMTFEKFKHYVIEYAEKSPYPTLTSK